MNIVVAVERGVAAATVVIAAGPVEQIDTYELSVALRCVALALDAQTAPESDAILTVVAGNYCFQTALGRRLLESTPKWRRFL